MTRYQLSSLVFLGAILCAATATAGTYNLCIGEYWKDGRHGGAICNGGAEPYAYCGTDPKVKAAELCKQEGSTGTPIVVQTGSHDGNKCGYAYYTITCQ
ncbi:MAG: hypothetical protein CML31_14130 [Rhizobiales bacterium]|nr:hypothetical protein [Hyphomicrobiales bacterium]